jgi:acylphosphatase
LGSDGTVYIEAEGEDKLLENFLACCQQGPRWAKVSRAKHQFSSQLKGYENFIIQY